MMGSRGGSDCMILERVAMIQEDFLIIGLVQEVGCDLLLSPQTYRDAHMQLQHGSGLGLGLTQWRSRAMKSGRAESKLAQIRDSITLSKNFLRIRLFFPLSLSLSIAHAKIPCSTLITLSIAYCS